MAVTPFDAATQNQINDLIQLSTNRIARTEPLHQAAVSMATRLAPSYARSGMTAPSTVPSRTPSGGGASDGPSVATPAIAAALAAMAGASSGGDLGPIWNLLKRLFGHGGNGSVQGDKPNAGGALMGPSTLPTGGPTSWATGLPWSQPYLPSDPGFYTGARVTDPSGGSGIGPGMQSYRGGGSIDPDLLAEFFLR